MPGAASTFITSLFNATVFFNSAHVIFNVAFGIPASEVGWFSIGHGTTMSNSRMMIMWPVARNDGEYEWMNAYCEASGHALPTRIWSPQTDSIRIEGPQKNDSNRLTMKYTRPLSLSPVDTFRRATDQKLVWAMSSIPASLDDDGTLGLTFHDKGYGTADLDFSNNPPLVLESLVQGSVTGVTELKHSKRHDVLITLHATFLTIAWALIAPSAILLSRFMRQRNSHKWIKVHWLLQVTTVILTLMGTLCAMLAVGSGSHFDTFQKRLGFFVVAAMLAQAFEGYIIHRLANRSQEKITSRPSRKSIANRLHKLCGCGLLLTAWLTLVFGIKEWEFLGRDTPLGVSILIGITCLVSILLYIFLLLRARSIGELLKFRALDKLCGSSSK